MDSFFEKLANSSFETRSSDHLSLLGKRAAGIYMRKEADSAGDAVRSVIESEDLNKDQARRVTEMANQAIWRESFHEGGANVSFDPADAGSVLGELETKPEMVNSDQAGMDYYDDVPNQVRDVDWSEAFGIKDDTPEYESLTSGHEEKATVEKTASALDFARFGADHLLADLATTGQSFYDMVKQAHLRDGFGVLQISQAVGQAIQDPVFASTIMQNVTERLQSEGVQFNEREELQKVAHKLVVNTSHPLLKTAAQLERLSFSYYTANETHENLRQRHRQAVGALREQLRGQ